MRGRLRATREDLGGGVAVRGEGAGRVAKHVRGSLCEPVATGKMAGDAQATYLAVRVGVLSA